MNYANEIKSAISMDEVVRFYGFEPNRSGFISCPFHGGDHTESLKIYKEPGRGFYCFACSAGNSVIDFVQKLFNLNFIDACKQLDKDFGLNIIPQSMDYRARKAAVQRARELADKQATEYAEYAQLYFDYSKALFRYKQNKRLTEQNPPGTALWHKGIADLSYSEYALIEAEGRLNEFKDRKHNRTDDPVMDGGRVPEYDEAV